MTKKRVARSAAKVPTFDEFLLQAAVLAAPLIGEPARMLDELFAAIGAAAPGPFPETERAVDALIARSDLALEEKVNLLPTIPAPVLDPAAERAIAEVQAAAPRHDFEHAIKEAQLLLDYMEPRAAEQRRREQRREAGRASVRQREVKYPAEPKYKKWIVIAARRSADMSNIEIADQIIDLGLSDGTGRRQICKILGRRRPEIEMLRRRLSGIRGPTKKS